MFSRLFDRYEAFLRIDRQGSRWDLMRARAVYVVAWLFALIQSLNLVALTYSYGEWTSSHDAAFYAAIAFVATSFLLRWVKSFHLYTAIFAVASFGALLVGSTKSGIYTSLLPFVVVGPMLAAFVAGWRYAVLFGCLGLAFLCFRLGTTPPDMAEIGKGGIAQRFFQASFALILGTTMSALLSATCRRAFERMEEALSEAQRLATAKSAFLATMSHELRTPLNGVLGLTDAVLDDRDEPVGAHNRHLLQHVRSSGEHLLTLLNDILDTAKIEAGKMRLEPRVFSLPSLLEAVRLTYAESAAAKGLSLTVKLEPGLTESVYGDDQRLRQVLSNLVSNAIKFTKRGGVEVEVRSGGEMVFFRVRDTGPGVPTGLRTRIFEPFEQGEAGVTRSFGGTGLGLPICRDLCILMGGGVEIERSGGEGSVFLVSLPLPAEASGERNRREVRNPAAAAAAGLDGLRALIAEDNEVNQMVLANFLGSWGVETVFAANGREALELIETARFDVVLADRQMPVMGGEAMVRTLRSRAGPAADLPVVAVTADITGADRQQMIDAGADAFVGKPFKPQELRRAIETAMAARELNLRGDTGVAAS